MGRRILVNGGSGSGKSTLALKLAERLGVPYIELDALHHGPNWSAASAEELQAKVLAVLDDRSGWVVDGNYDSKLGTLVVDRADLVIWLDIALRIKLARLFQRSVRRMLKNEELWNGNRESIRGLLWGGDALFAWAVRTHFRHRRLWPSRLATLPLVRLRTPEEVDTWISEFLAPL